MFAANSSNYYFDADSMRMGNSHTATCRDDVSRISSSDDPNQMETDNCTRPRQRRRQQTEVKKMCRVCGDKAYSVNFNVITCESCKAFFRRNALKKKEMRCQTAGNCDISIQTRRSCKKCRLKKCFEVGMIKEWIMSDEARLKKRELIERNREKRQRVSAFGKSGDSSDADQYPESNESTSAAPTSMEFKPVSCTMPTALAEFSPPGPTNWQLPNQSFYQQQSPSSSSILFQHHGPTSAFQPPTIFPSPTPSTPGSLYASTVLPIERTVPSNSIQTPVQPHASAQIPDAAAAGVGASSAEEVIRVPKTLLAALINQCHNAVLTCIHGDEMKQSNSRPSVIVRNKINSTPLTCICRCRCGAKGAWKPMEDEDGEKNAQQSRPNTMHHDSDTSDESDLEDSTGGQLALSRKCDMGITMKFDFGISGVKLMHLNDLFNAFSYPKKAIGRPVDDTRCMPKLPPIDRYHQGQDCFNRFDLMIRRLVRFCGSIMLASNLKKRMLGGLIKACCPELMMLHSTLCYSTDSDAWYDQGPNIRPIAANLDLTALKGNVYREHVGMIKAFPRSCKNDVAVIVSLCAVALFNPNRVEAKDRENVQLLRIFYVNLLTQYLERTFDNEKALKIRDNLIWWLDTCSKIGPRITPTIVMELDDRDLEPLLVETLDYT